MQEEGPNHRNIWEKSITGRGNIKYTYPATGLCLRDSKKTSVAGEEKAKHYSRYFIYTDSLNSESNTVKQVWLSPFRRLGNRSTGTLSRLP